MHRGMLEDDRKELWVSDGVLQCVLLEGKTCFNNGCGR